MNTKKIFKNLTIFFSSILSILNSNIFHFPGKAFKNEKWKTENFSESPENCKRKTLLLTHLYQGLVSVSVQKTGIEYRVSNT